MKFHIIASILSVATVVIASPAIVALQGRQWPSSGGTNADSSVCKAKGGAPFCCNSATTNNTVNQNLLSNLLGQSAQGCIGQSIADVIPIPIGPIQCAITETPVTCCQATQALTPSSGWVDVLNGDQICSNILNV